MITALVRENPDVVIVDSGNQSDKPGRLDLIMSILSDLKYDAIGIGIADRQLEKEFLEAASKHSMTVVDAGAFLPPEKKDGESVAPEWRIVSYVVKNVAGVRVGIISFGAPATNASEEEEPRAKRMELALKEVRAACDVLIALDQAGFITREWLKRNARQIGAPDLVIGGSSRSESPPVEIVERCHIVQTSVNGSHVGVVDVEFVPGQSPRLTFDRIPLDRTVPEDPNVKHRVAKFLDSIGQSSVASKLVDSGTAQSGYLHPHMCRSCHDREYQDWTATKHARALKTLDQNNRLIPECLQCHSEAFRRARTVSVPSGGIGGVECITCHRIPVPHWGDTRAPSGTWKVDPKLCLECHTPERSASYNQATYLPKVSHGTIPVVKPPAASGASKKRK